jgi:hypothetical protein
VEHSGTARGCDARKKTLVEQGLKMRLDFLFLFDQAKRKERT